MNLTFHPQFLNDAMAQWRDDIEKATLELVRQHNLAAEQLTQEQLADAIRQAIACRDFVRLIAVSPSVPLAVPPPQQVVYIPFARERELLNRIEQLEKELKAIQAEAQK